VAFAVVFTVIIVMTGPKPKEIIDPEIAESE
jgi:hypothetical protein